jgi:hypothetical protein
MPIDSSTPGMLLCKDVLSSLRIGGNPAVLDGHTCVGMGRMQSTSVVAPLPLWDHA